MFWKKNLFVLLRAFREASHPHDRLELVGDGPDLDALERYADKLGLSSRVTFSGALSGEALANAYGRNQTLVLASQRETWGMVVNEALALGLRVVVTSDCGVASSVRGWHGVLIADSDDYSLAQALGAAREMPPTSGQQNPLLEFGVDYNVDKVLLAVDWATGAVGE